LVVHDRKDLLRDGLFWGNALEGVKKSGCNPYWWGRHSCLPFMAGTVTTAWRWAPLRWQECLSHQILIFSHLLGYAAARTVIASL
jgi:hypothetical protein